MTQEFFLLQIDRLKSRFGAKNFDPSFVQVVGREVATVSPEHFRQTVDTWIGTRKTMNPPLLTDFRECRIAHDKTKFQAEVQQASNVFHYGLGDVLRRVYKVDTLKEALELERTKLKLEELANEDGPKRKRD